jgi:hypothetical protein
MFGFTVHAIDGEIGRVKDFYVDEVLWLVRYLIINIGNWSSEKYILLSTAAIGRTGLLSIDTNLTTDQIRSCPGVDLAKPLTRKYEEELHRLFVWPFYWGDEKVHAMDPVRKGNTKNLGNKLISVRDIREYRIHCSDGEIGSVHDFLIEDDGWEVKFLVADVGAIHLGGRVLIPLDNIYDVKWEMAIVECKVSKETIRNAPPFLSIEQINPEYEEQVLRYFKS